MTLKAVTHAVPLVSVIVPTFNRRCTIGDALESIARQTYKSVQVIVVDDGSTDDTGDLIAREFPNVTYFKQNNRGQAAARNAGLSLVEGTYVASLDSDDIWCPAFIEKSVDALEKLDVDFVFSNWRAIRKDGTAALSYFEKDVDWQAYPISAQRDWRTMSSQEARNQFLAGCPSPTSSLLFRAENIKTGWFEKLKIADDWCLLLDQVLQKDCRVAFTMEHLWTKRVPGDNIYDERNPDEVRFELDVLDAELMVTRFRHALSSQECSKIQRRYSKVAAIEFVKEFRSGNFAKCETLAGYVFRGSVGAITSDPLTYGRLLLKSIFAQSGSIGQAAESKVGAL